MEGLFSSLGLKSVPGAGMAALGKHNPLLVILSFLIALFAVRAFLELSRHIMTVHSRRQRYFWILAAAVSFGGGIWSMHFTAMLAYHVGVPIHYDWGRTLLSLAIPILICAAGLALLAGWRRAVARHPLLSPVPNLLPVLLVGLMMGLSLVLMHYLGMKALHMRAVVYYRPGAFWITVSLGAAGGIALLWLTALWALLLWWNWSPEEVTLFWTDQRSKIYEARLHFELVYKAWFISALVLLGSCFWYFTYPYFQVWAVYLFIVGWHLVALALQSRFWELWYALDFGFRKQTFYYQQLPAPKVADCS